MAPTPFPQSCVYVPPIPVILYLMSWTTGYCEITMIRGLKNNWKLPCSLPDLCASMFRLRPHLSLNTHCSLPSFSSTPSSSMLVITYYLLPSKKNGSLLMLPTMIPCPSTLIAFRMVNFWLISTFFTQQTTNVSGQSITNQALLLLPVGKTPTTSYNLHVKVTFMLRQRA